MATYTSSSMHGSGVLGEALSGAKTFTLTNNPNNFGFKPVGYLTLEGNATANQALTSNQSLSGSFSTFTNVSQSNLLASGYRFSISVANGGGSFQFTPGSSIGQNTYYIKSTGNFKLVIS